MPHRFSICSKVNDFILVVVVVVAVILSTETVPSSASDAYQFPSIGQFDSNPVNSFVDRLMDNLCVISDEQNLTPTRFAALTKTNDQSNLVSVTHRPKYDKQ